MPYRFLLLCFFFNDTATTEIYTLSLHDALPIYSTVPEGPPESPNPPGDAEILRSEEHTSELQPHSDLVCRLLLEKKKTERHGRSRLLTRKPPTTPASRELPA